MTGSYDVVVVGGGAAGLSAALVLGRARRRVLVVDAGAPRNAPASHMQGFLSRDGLPPAELLRLGRAEVARYGVEVRTDLVVSVDRTGDDDVVSFDVALASGPVVQARRVLVTIGVSDELPEVAGARERWGLDLLHCPYCHGWEVQDQPLAVLGTGPGSVQHAHLIRQWSDDMVYVTHTCPPSDVERAALERRGIRVVDGTATRLVVEDDHLVGIDVAGVGVVRRDAVFIRPGNRQPADGLLARLGCDADPAGSAVVDRDGRTSVAGVWAAGNVVDPRLQVIAAAGAANLAAMAVNADLVAEDVQRSLP